MSTATNNVLKMPSKTQEPSDEILTLEEAAAFLKVTKRMLYDRVQKNKIPYLKLGKLIRFEKQSLLEWMRKQSHSGQ